MRENLQQESINQLYFDGGQCGDAAEAGGNASQQTLEQMGGIFLIAAVAVLVSLLVYLCLCCSGTATGMQAPLDAVHSKAQEPDRLSAEEVVVWT